ncbi:hypothetical protein [Microvirga makkahensis]|nr:hypothetical protein [Microvirga makkahensis]
MAQRELSLRSGPPLGGGEITGTGRVMTEERLETARKNEGKEA